jgi:prolipoprotein diacylglyceryltransferase
MKFPVYFYVGDWQIHPHIVFELLAYLFAFQLLLWRNIRRYDTVTPSQRSSVLTGGLIGALVGAKILVLLQHINLLTINWQQYLLLFAQGKTIVGGLLGGLIGVEITKKKIGVTRSTGDVFVYPLIFGTILGRIGCFLTGLSDRTYGVATNLPWGIDFGDGIPRHPTQLYEVIFLLALALFLRLKSRQSWKEGELFQFYLMAYLGFRFVIDFWKPDFHLIWQLSAVQVACLLGLVYYLKFKH